jgi:hypothetical protein
MSEHVVNNKKGRRHSLPLFLYDLSSAGRLLPPAAVLPEQFYGAPTQYHRTEGVVALMRAVLADAIDCFQNQARKSTAQARMLGHEAEQWIFTNDDSWPFSFVNICKVLEMDVGYVRQGLRRWQLSPSVHLATKRVRKAAVRPLSLHASRR